MKIVIPHRTAIRGWILGLWALAALLCWSTTGALAQVVEEARVVQDIEVRYLGSKGVDESRIRANMDTKVGDTLSQESLENDIKNLYESGDVDDVRILTEDVAGGVKLIVVISARAVLGAVDFEGNASFSDTKLQRTTELEIGRGFDDADLQLAQTEIEDLYRDKGYADVLISYRVEDTPDGFSRVVFTVDEGSKALLKDISFEGNTVLSERDLRKEIEVKERSIWRLFIGGGKIDNDVLAEDVARIRRAYGDLGYIDADVEVSTQRVSDEKVNLVFQITEGEKYEVASVAIEGNTIFTDDELYAALLTEAGEPYSVTYIQTDEKTLRDFYGAKGYADVRIDTRIDRAPGNQLGVTYSIFEGEKSYIRKINIGGNQKTQDKVIRRELAVAPGDEYNLVKIDTSKRRLETLQYFSNIDVFPSETADVGYKDLNITVQEQSTGSVNFGVGFSSIDNLVGFVDVVQTNFDLFGWGNGFTGGGQRFQAGAKVGTERRDISVSLYEPWFNDYRLGLGGEVYLRDLLFLSDDYDQSNIGGTVYVRKPIGDRADYFQLGYRLQNVEIDVDSDASEILLAEEGDFLQSMLQASLVFDRRDSNLITRSGHRVSVGGSFSGLGGDVETYGFEVAGSKYFLLPFDTIFSLRGEVNVTDAWGDDHVPIFERQFLGGANTLRGFDYRDVGPKDENGEAIGGLTAAFASVEYTFPIITRVRGALFYDVGMVSEDSWDFGGDLNSNVGIGLRLYLPIGPINVDFGIPVQSDEHNDSGGKFQFNMGYSF